MALLAGEERAYRYARHVFGRKRVPARLRYAPSGAEPCEARQVRADGFIEKWFCGCVVVEVIIEFLEKILLSDEMISSCAL